MVRAKTRYASDTAAEKPHAVAGVVYFEDFGSGGLIQYGKRTGVVVEEKHVQVAILVIIEKSGLGTGGRAIEAVFGGFFYKNGLPIGRHTLVDKQLIGSLFGCQTPRITHVNIQEKAFVFFRFLTGLN